MKTLWIIYTNVCVWSNKKDTFADYIKFAVFFLIYFFFTKYSQSIKNTKVFHFNKGHLICSNKACTDGKSF